MRKQGCWFSVLLSSPSESKGASNKNTAKVCFVNLGRFFCFFVIS